MKTTNEQATASPPPSRPLRITLSQQEAESALTDWMLQSFGYPCKGMATKEEIDRWFRDEGMIRHFLRSLFTRDDDTRDHQSDDSATSNQP